jgi:tRNA1(Val) A37 N6-methylase TrmN6
MSILNTNIENIDQSLIINNENKKLYGEVNTPFSLINDMFSLFPEEILKNKHLKWLDVGAGSGNFSIVLFQKLNKSLLTQIPDSSQRIKYIIKNMIFLVEINPNSINLLKERFGEYGNIYSGNYLEMSTSFVEPDIIIGNPPYNFNGLKKVPTLRNVEKTKDGITIWTHFVKKNIEILKPGGWMNIIIPSIWLKPDKAGINNLLLQFKIIKMHTIDGNKANQLFYKNGQTPLVYFLLQKKKTNNQIYLYDSVKRDYELWNTQEYKSIYDIIPLDYSSILKKVLEKTKKYGCLQVIKTNMPSKNAIILDEKTSNCIHSNVHTCRLKEKKYVLIQKYSDIPLPFSNEPKIILAHKMWGIPYLDKEGKYGISNRDNYVIKDKSIQELQKIKDCLESKLIIFLYNATRFRMKYLEKYIFRFLPDFSLIQDLDPKDIYSFFGITDNEKRFIEKIKKNYVIN